MARRGDADCAGTRRGVIGGVGDGVTEPITIEAEMSGEETREQHLQNYFNWRSQCTVAEYKLLETACRLEERYFADLRLIAPSVRRRLLRYEVQMEGKWLTTEGDPPDVSIVEWIFRIVDTIEQSKDCLGLCDYTSRAIYIASSLNDEDRRGTLLHELIHAYEFQLQYEMREWLALDLYRRLLRRMSAAKVHRYMDANNHGLFLVGGHGVLFLLKSLELDMRLKWKPGTVFGYGRDDYFGEKPR